MKYLFYRLRYYLFILLSVSSLCTACGDYLDRVPEKDIETIESVFEQRANADRWLRGIYQETQLLITDIGINPAYFGADEFVTGENVRNRTTNLNRSLYPGFKIADGLQMAQRPYGNIWDEGGVYNGCSFYENIRYCNIFIANIDNVYNMETLEKQQWKAEVKALKAFLYFELVRHYGPIVLVPENIAVDVDISLMQQPRIHVDTCFRYIVQMLDEASESLLNGNARPFLRSAYFSKEAALALKAKVLLYAASPLFNGNEFYSDFKGKNGEPLFSTTYDPEKWRLAAEAADVAVAECERAEHQLTSGTSARGTALLTTMSDVENSVHSKFSNSEFILEWKDCAYFKFHIMCMPLVKSSMYYFYNSQFWGCVSPSMKMVEMYYTENGLPIDADITWNYSSRYQMAKESSPRYNGVVPFNTDVLGLHLRREPRFYANIAADRLKWQLGPLSGYVDYNPTVTAYKGEDFGTSLDIISSTEKQNINGYWLKKFQYSTQTLPDYSVSADETLAIIRLADLYLMQAEAWNEYLDVPNNEKVYAPLNKVRKRAGILDVVTAWKSYSKYPARVDTKEGMREIIRQEINIELAFEGHRFWNLRRWKTAHLELNEKQMGWNVLGENAQTFYNNWAGPVEVWNKCKFTAPRDYLFPINAEEVLISGVVQNPNW